MIEAHSAIVRRSQRSIIERGGLLGDLNVQFDVNKNGATIGE